MLLDEEFHQAQTDSEALARIGVLLVEEVEHLFPDTGRDAVPVVPDREPERPSPVVVQDAEDDLDRRTGVFQGVGEQVAQDLGEGLAVGIEQDVRIGAVRADGDLFGRVAESCDGLLDQQADVDFTAAQPEPLVVHLPEVEQLADEFEQAVDVPFHDVEVGGYVAVPFPGFDDSFERGLDQRNRRLDLVGHLGEERHLGLDQLLFLLFALPPENDPDPADDQQHDQQEIDALGDGAEKGMGLYADLQAAGRIAPVAVVVAAPHPEDVAASGQFHERHGVLVGVDPVAVETFQFPRIAVLPRGHVAQTLEIDVEGDRFAGDAQVPVGGGLPFRTDREAVGPVHADRRNDDLRPDLVDRDVERREDVEAVYSPE
ncbi:hypothetical protein, partial [Alistipes sp.]|uniref:hypothetical protein n=1 Tax=Alistipes sp. TaxID=1872444 RepID=UPI00307BFB78